MALSKYARSKLLRLVQQSKKLLFSSIIDQLQKNFGIFPQSGKVLLLDELTSNDSDILFKARLLRDRLDYIKTNLADIKNEGIDSIEQLIREQAFTILNRMCALRMAEERNIIRETLRKGYQSEGFQVYDSITGQGSTTEIFKRYQWFLYAIFDELALDLPAIFDRFSPYGILFPDEKSLLDLLSLINSDELTLHREEGQQPINFWQQDETIGWIYQYYNSKEEISAMREASDNPRNSREMAVRNQFFTPRYVVQFLTDNSLGRIWYEMTKGRTKLKDCCSYLIIRPDEVFLEAGQPKPANARGETQYIEYRAIKDPREIKLLDPACGSMHFGLYAFDLFERIYFEAWDDYKDLLTDLKNTISRVEFVKKIPEFIIRYNIHGVDIDPRALQIAALSLWLRAQKSFDQLRLQPADRPPITKSNLVLAEPMPGNVELLSEVVKHLDAPMRKLVLHIWEIMQMAGETGLLLRVENEIDTKIQEIEKGLKEEAKNAQVKIGTSPEQKQLAKEAAKYASKEYRKEFLDKAESQVFITLKSLAEELYDGRAYQKLLFANDSTRGFAFIELCRQQYDVVVMNPPFGAASANSERYISVNYPNWAKNILAAFFSRMLELLNNSGLCGAIFDRTVSIKSSYENFRKECLCGHITSMADTGWNVLEANVETTTSVIKPTKDDYKGIFIGLLSFDFKEVELLKKVQSIKKSNDAIANIEKSSLTFEYLPNSIIGYYYEDYLINLFSKNLNLIENGYQARQGHALVSFIHFRTFWENIRSIEISHLYNGYGYSLFYIPLRDINYSNTEYLSSNKSVVLRNLEYQQKQGIGYGKRGDIFDAHLLKKEFTFTSEGQSIPDIEKEGSFLILSYLNSVLAQFLINLFCGQHKHAGYINLLPLPNHKFNSSDVVKIIDIKRKWYSIDETTLEFHHFLTDFAKSESIKKELSIMQSHLIADKESYDNFIENNDNFWLDVANIPYDARPSFEEFKKKRPKENLITIDGVTDETIENNPSMAHEIISNLLGVAFGRWDIRSIMDSSLIPDFGDFFDPLPFMPVVSLSGKPNNYPLDFPEDGLFIQDNRHPRCICKAIENVVFKIWGKGGNDILFELSDIGNYPDLQEFFTKPAGFFDFHYNRYTKSHREAPIYWPLSTQSGSYIVWVYYPRLNDQTLYKIVNDFVKPKREDVQNEIRQLQNNPNLDNKGKKELLDKQEFLHELQVFEKELVRVANLPYKPNHDDGVLITAAPLHNLFRHNKWHKSTEECWKSLEKGEFDWAHMAYSIWPDRVRKKCKNDLSMAIAHGLEEICEIKPKEVKEKKNKQPKQVIKDTKLNLE